MDSALFTREFVASWTVGFPPPQVNLVNHSELARKD